MGLLIFLKLCFPHVLIRSFLGALCGRNHAPFRRTGPAGQVVISSSLQMVDGSPKVVNVLAPVAIGDVKAAVGNQSRCRRAGAAIRNRVSVATYAGSTNPVRAADSPAFIVWRDAAPACMFEQLAAVEAGDKKTLSLPEFMAGIHPVDWPMQSGIE